MFNSVWVKLVIYASLAFLPPYIAFMADVFGAWKEDHTVRMDAPAWVWAFITLQALLQVALTLRAYLDSSYARHTDEVEEKSRQEASTGNTVTPQQ